MSEAAAHPRLAAAIDHYLRAKRYASIYSLLVLQRGQVMYERYFHGFGAHDGHQIMSVIKSFFSALTGVALRLGLLSSLDTPICELLSEYPHFRRDPLLKGITVRHLLTMSSGLYWQPGVHVHQPMLQRIAASPDWTGAVLDLPLQHRPGTRFLYKETDSILISAVISHAAGMNAYDFACQHLFPALELHSPPWPQDPQGNSHGYVFLGTGIAMTARNMAKLGLLYLNEGRWEGQEILTPEFVAESRRPVFPMRTNGVDYGLMWWVRAGYSLASGYGGQTIAVVPGHELVVVIQAEYDRGIPKMYDGMIPEVILPNLA